MNEKLEEIKTIINKMSEVTYISNIQEKYDMSISMKKVDQFKEINNKKNYIETLDMLLITAIKELSKDMKIKVLNNEYRENDLRIEDVQITNDILTLKALINEPLIWSSVFQYKDINDTLKSLYHNLMNIRANAEGVFDTRISLIKSIGKIFEHGRTKYEIYSYTQISHNNLIEAFVRHWDFVFQQKDPLIGDPDIPELPSIDFCIANILMIYVHVLILSRLKQYKKDKMDKESRNI